MYDQIGEARPMEPFTVGAIVVFDIGTATKIGMIERIEGLPGGRECFLLEPSGHRRRRALDHDFKAGTLRLLARDEACFLSSSAWKAAINDHKNY